MPASHPAEPERPSRQPATEPPLAAEALEPPFLVEPDPTLPVAAAAVHDGHLVRPEVAAALALDEQVRRREEDPFTAGWTRVVGTRLVARRSRFEVDLNRPRERAICRVPDDCWGLQVWRAEPAEELVEHSLAIHDAFYAAAERALAALEARWGSFVVLDLHSYNHRRAGPDAPPAAAEENPEINVGTGSLDRRRWGHVVDRFMADLRAGELGGHAPDVRENVKFRGGYFSTWIHERFPDSGCALAVEFRKEFMDEWSGAPDEARIADIGRLLAGTIPGLVEEVLAR